MAPHPVWGQVRHRHLGFDAHPRSQWPLPAPGHGPGPLHRGSSKPGWPPAPTRGASALRSSRWMDSPGLRALPLKNSPERRQSWIPSTSYTSPATPWMSAADAFSKNFTIGAGVPRIPCTRPAECLHTRSCLLTPRQQHQLADLFASDCHVALEVTWSVYQNITWRLPRARHGRG